MVARLDALTRVHTFVEDIELSLDPDPIDVEVMQTEDGYRRQGDSPLVCPRRHAAG